MALGAGSASNFMRGWETLSHSLQMFRTSTGWLMVVSVVLGVGIGGGWFAATLSGEARQHLGEYASATIASEGLKLRDAMFTIRPEQKKRDAKHGPESKRRAYQDEIYGGRSAPYLALQGGCRVALATALMLVVGATFATRHGRGVMSDRHLRGVRLVAQSRPRKKAGFLLVGVSCAAFAMAVCGCLWPRGVTEYAWAAALYSYPDLASFFTPAGFDIPTAWFSDPVVAGFYDPVAVYQHFRNEVFGAPFSWVLATWGASATAAAILATCFRHRQSKRKASTQGKRVVLAGVPVELEDECMHFLITGSPGAGKSEAIKQVLTRIRSRGQRAIVYDISGEWVEAFYRPGIDKILNPLDARSEAWTLWADADDAPGYVELARSLFPETARDPFWSDAPTNVFAAAAELLARQGGPTNAKFYEMLSCATLPDLSKLLKGTPAERFLSSDGGAMPQNVLATVTSKTAAWAWLPEVGPNQKPFSIRRFVQQEDDSWLFLSVCEDKFKAMRPLVSLWYDLAASSILSLPSSDTRRLWCVLDEISSLHRLAALENLMPRSRKKGAPVVLGLQSISQLRESYTHDGAAALASMAQTWLILRTTEPETAEWLERAIGSAEVEESRTSLSMGVQAKREGVSIQHNVRQRPIVLASEITCLPNMEGYLKQPGRQEVRRVKYAYDPTPRSQPAFVPRVRSSKAG